MLVYSMFHTAGKHGTVVIAQVNNILWVRILAPRLRVYALGQVI